MVADVSPSQPIGGGERMLWEQARHLAARGHDVRVVSRADPGVTAPVSLEREGVRIRQFPVAQGSVARFIRSSILEARHAVADELAREPVDVLHVHQPLAGGQQRVAVVRKGVADPVGKTGASQIDRPRGEIGQFHEFCARTRRVVVQLRNGHLTGFDRRRPNLEESLIQRGPFSAVFGSGLEQCVFADDRQRIAAVIRRGSGNVQFEIKTCVRSVEGGLVQLHRNQVLPRHEQAGRQSVFEKILSIIGGRIGEGCGFHGTRGDGAARGFPAVDIDNGAVIPLEAHLNAADAEVIGEIEATTEISRGPFPVWVRAKWDYRRFVTFAVTELGRPFAPPAVVESRMFPIRGRPVWAARHNVTRAKSDGIGEPAPAGARRNQRFDEAGGGKKSRGRGHGAAGQAGVRAVQGEINCAAGLRAEPDLEPGRDGTALLVEHGGVEGGIESGVLICCECFGSPLGQPVIDRVIATAGPLRRGEVIPTRGLGDERALNFGTAAHEARGVS